MWQAVSQLTPLGARAGQADWAEQAVTQDWMEDLDMHKSQGNLLAETKKCRPSLRTLGHCCSRDARGQADPTRQRPSLLDRLPSSVASGQPGQKQTQCHILVPFKTVASFTIIIIIIF